MAVDQDSGLRPANVDDVEAEARRGGTGSSKRQAIGSGRQAAGGEALGPGLVPFGVAERAEPEEGRSDPDTDTQANHEDSYPAVNIEGQPVVGDRVDASGRTKGREENGEDRYDDRHSQPRLVFH